MHISSFRQITEQHPLVTFVATFIASMLALNLVDAAASAWLGQEAATVPVEDLLGVIPLSGDIAAAVVILIFLGLFFPRRLLKTRVSAILSEKRGLHPAIIGAILVAIALFAVLVQFAFGSFDYLSGNERNPSTLWAGIIYLVVLCIATGIFEEGLFRVIAITCFFRAGQQSEATVQSRANTYANLMRACIISSLLFGLMHISISSGFTLSSFDGQAPVSVMPFWLMLLRFIQTTLFGLCLAGVFLHSISLWPCAIIHTLFDMVFLAPSILLSTFGIDALAFESLFSLPGLVITTVLFVPMCILSLKWVKRAVLPYAL